jgi:hypothetical protein
MVSTISYSRPGEGREPMAGEGRREPMTCDGRRLPMTCEGSRESRAGDGSREAEAGEGSREPKASEGSKESTADEGRTEPTTGTALMLGNWSGPTDLGTAWASDRADMRLRSGSNRRAMSTTETASQGLNRARSVGTMS